MSNPTSNILENGDWSVRYWEGYGAMILHKHRVSPTFACAVPVAPTSYALGHTMVSCTICDEKAPIEMIALRDFLNL